MKTQTIKRFVLGALIFGMSSCVYVDNTPGPHGRPGDAWFGVDYETHPIHSYWDNNSEIPYNPHMGTYYFTYPGIYDFEYFFNSYEYWYGTYEIWVNQGGHGGCRLWRSDTLIKKTPATTGVFINPAAQAGSLFIIHF